MRVQGDELITIAQAAELVGVTVQAMSQRVKRGTLTAYVDPAGRQRQGRALVRRSDVEAEEQIKSSRTRGNGREAGRE